MKWIPNFITISRMFLSLMLPFIIHQPELFLFVFLLCGITDILDGYLARKWGVNNNLGAKLDSIADTMLFLIMTYLAIRLLGDRISSFIPIILVIIVVRFFNVIFAYTKYGCFLMVHTLANKATGLCIYGVILIYQIIPRMEFVWIAFTIAFLSAIEETLLHITQKYPDPERKGLFFP